MSSPERPDSTILSTGWRITGRNAARVAEQARQGLEGLLPGATRDTLYAVLCTAKPSAKGRPVVEQVLEALTDEVRRSWPACPRLLRDEPVTHPATRFGGVRYDVESAPGRSWLGELTWRTPHPVVAGAPITTRVHVEETSSFVRLAVRVTADGGPPSVRGYVGAGQVQPSFLRALGARVPLTWLASPVQVFPLRSGELTAFASDVLAARSRDYPVTVLAPHEDGTYVVPPDELVWDLFGRARLYVIADHRVTFELSDAVGDRRMSCYWGAARCYLPGWSRHDDPLDHPLLVADRLEDPVLRAQWLGEIGVAIGTQLVLPPTFDERRADPVAPSPAVAVAAAEPEARAERTSPEADVLVELRKLGGEVTRLADELERLRTLSAVRASSTNAIERRLVRVEELLEQLLPHEPERAVPAAASARDEPEFGLLETVQSAAESHGDALVFLDGAFAGAQESPYEDPERVRAVLDAMARVARRRRDGVLGTSLREAFADLGIDYRPGIARSTPAKLREQYRFHYRAAVIEAEEHIALGGTYDPRRCLRVYFSSRVPNEPRFVIAHVGRHFDVMSTS